ncbi:ClpP/crotonase-like domain-containing protein [Dipodascopsis uninucleata]
MDEPTLPFEIKLPKEKGKLTLSKTETYYLLTFCNPPDNRLTIHTLLNFLQMLDVLEIYFLPREKLPLVTTSSISKFYSNGLDLKMALSTKGFFENSFNPVLKRLLSYPVPCVALINGHAFAGGFMISMCHDYRVMNPSKGFLCLNEVEFGSRLTGPMAAIFREKTTPHVYQKIVLEATRFTADKALENNLIDAKGGIEQVEELIKNRKLIELAQSPAYALLKAEMWRDIIYYCDLPFVEEENKLDEDAKTKNGQIKKRLSLLSSKL